MVVYLADLGDGQLEVDREGAAGRGGGQHVLPGQHLEGTQRREILLKVEVRMKVTHHNFTLLTIPHLTFLSKK